MGDPDILQDASEVQRTERNLTGAKSRHGQEKRGPTRKRMNQSPEWAGTNDGAKNAGEGEILRQEEREEMR